MVGHWGLGKCVTKDICHPPADLWELLPGIQIEASGMQFEKRASGVAGVAEPHPGIAVSFSSQARTTVMVKRTVGR